MTTVADYYEKEVATIEAGASVLDAADAMQQKAVGSLVVMREGRPTGILTDRDLLERVIAAGKDAGTVSAEEAMSQPLHTVGAEEPLDRVVEVMSAQGIRRIPVMARNELTGIVTLDDVLVALADELHDLAEGTRRELGAAQRGARAREIGREVEERARDLGEQLRDAGGEVRAGVLRELERLRERIRGQHH